MDGSAPFAITAIYAGLLGLVFLALTARVITRRGRPAHRSAMAATSHWSAASAPMPISPNSRLWA